MNDIKVWDIFVRVFHSALVASFFIAYITEDVMWLHEFAGYTILALVAARVIWGIIGTRYARFSNFVFKPSTIKQYFKDSLRFKSTRYLGHNPLGGAMVIVLLVMLVLTSLSGIKAEGGNIFAGASDFNIEIIKSAIADDDNDREQGGSEFWEEIHEFLAQATLLLIFLHVAGVIFSSIAHGENLVRSMVTGMKRKDDL